MNIEDFTTALSHHIARELLKAQQFPDDTATASREDAESLDTRTQLARAMSQCESARTAAEHLARHWRDNTDAERAAAIKRIQDDPTASLYPRSETKQ